MRSSRESGTKVKNGKRPSATYSHIKVHCEATSGSKFSDKSHHATKCDQLFNGCHSRCSARSSSAYNDVMDDELLIVKKKCAQLFSENQALKLRCEKLKDQIDKQGEEIVNPSDPGQSSRLLQTIGENKHSLARKVLSLEKKIYKLEVQLQEKEYEYNRIATDLKYTKVEELRIQLEMAFSEVTRLNTIITELKASKKSPNSGPNRPKLKETMTKPVEDHLKSRLQTMEDVVKGLDTEKQELLAKNEVLLRRIQQLTRPHAFKREELTENICHTRRSKMASGLTVASDSGDVKLIATLVASKLTDQSKHSQAKLTATRIENPTKLSPESVEDTEHTVHSLLEKSTESVNRTSDKFSSNKIGNKNGSQQIIFPRNSLRRKQERSAAVIQRAWRLHKISHSSFEQRPDSGSPDEKPECILKKSSFPHSGSQFASSFTNPPIKSEGENESFDIREDTEYSSASFEDEDTERIMKLNLTQE